MFDYNNSVTDDVITVRDHFRLKCLKVRMATKLTLIPSRNQIHSN